MEFLGIGPLEALFILLIALIAVGPRDIGKAARSTGRLLNQLYHSEAWQNLNEASRSLRGLPSRLAREAQLEELEKARREIEDSVSPSGDSGARAESEREAPSDSTATHAKAESEAKDGS